MLEGNLPVERGNEGIEVEWTCSMEAILAPNSVPTMLAILRNAISVIDADNDGKEPCDNAQDLVCPNGLDGMRLPSGEGVCWKTLESCHRSILMLQRKFILT